MARATTIRRQRSTARRAPGVRRSTRGARPAARTRAAQSRRSRSTPASTRSRPRIAQGARRRNAGDRGIQRFLDGFVQDLTAGDGKAAAARFDYPALMVMSAVGDSGGNRLLGDERGVAAFFAQAPDQYHAKGIYETFADVERVDWIADDLALVRVHLPYIDADGNDMGDGETSAYVLRKAGGDHFICAAITLGADSDRLRARSRQRNR